MLGLHLINGFNIIINITMIYSGRCTENEFLIFFCISVTFQRVVLGVVIVCLFCFNTRNLGIIKGRRLMCKPVMHANQPKHELAINYRFTHNSVSRRC